jgi:hypothetical protein
MNVQTAELLLQTLTQALRIANENTLRLKALESALEHRQPDVFHEYQEGAEFLLKKQDFGNLTLSIEALRKGLLQG